jgi:hypothetical protein
LLESLAAKISAKIWNAWNFKRNEEVRRNPINNSEWFCNFFMRYHITLIRAQRYLINLKTMSDASDACRQSQGRLPIAPTTQFSNQIKSAMQICQPTISNLNVMNRMSEDLSVYDAVWIYFQWCW